MFALVQPLSSGTIDAVRSMPVREAASPGGDPHGAYWWAAFVALVVLGLVAATVVGLLEAVRAGNTTAADAAASAEKRHHRSRAHHAREEQARAARERASA